MMFTEVQYPTYHVTVIIFFMMADGARATFRRSFFVPVTETKRIVMKACHFNKDSWCRFKRLSRESNDYEYGCNEFVSFCKQVKSRS